MTNTTFSLNSEINRRFFGSLLPQELEASYNEGTGQFCVANLIVDTCIYRINLLFQLGPSHLEDIAYVISDEHGLGFCVPDGQELNAMRAWDVALERRVQDLPQNKVDTVKQKIVFNDATNRGRIMSILEASGCALSRLRELEEVLWSVWEN
ncbi:hypothetical protein E7T06_15715 [Deinococcus sp. Arct2-2]|uniref:hypothetical protein n=1 Tax=Deinococcus sp. Arct2-2 TaxID=2568653 RepID=UPI0010A571C5|nr:hypothetical protein [Deinococcus sp. Arct2-2]THF68636.1 hypothetical protein E7T06_15715 [Deinococcus sp. Arct2-2]